jgi:hypothetical protein
MFQPPMSHRYTEINLETHQPLQVAASLSDLKQHIKQHLASSSQHSSSGNSGEGITARSSIPNKKRLKDHALKLVQ